MAFALTGARVFNGTRFLEDHAILVEADRIAAVVEAGAVPAGVDTHRIEGILAPGFVDVQVNGGGGVLFNDARSVEGIRAIGAAHRRFGTTGFLPTFISDTRPRMEEAIGAVREAMREHVPGVLGIHVEGPFLNPARKGVHDPRHFRPLEESDAALLESLAAGRTLVTLAPEMVPAATIGRLAAAGVIVSAGHTEASVERLRDARAAGLTGYTHLFNAMPPLASRAPGPVGAALDDPGAFCGLIVDLHHVAAETLRIAIAAGGAGRMMLVTDAMPSVGTDIESFDLLGTRVFRRDGRLATEEGTLAGSDLDMAGAVRNCAARLGLPVETALRMASLNPARFLRLDHEIGRIAPGYRASFVLLDDALGVKGTWIDGVFEAADGNA